MVPPILKGNGKGVRDTIRSSADGELTAKTMAGSGGEIRLAVYYLKQALINMEIEEPEWVEEYDEWGLEFNTLAKGRQKHKQHGVWR